MRAASFLAGALLLSGCVDGVSPPVSAFEPLSVKGGEFFAGPIPAGDGPKVQTILAPSTQISPGYGGWSVSGDADLGAYAVAMRFTELGTGYWSVPVGPPDVQVSGAVTWAASCAFSQSLPTGSFDLEFAAIGGDGHYGPLNTLTLDLLSAVPTGSVVITLRWDSAADLDLHLVAPSGAELWSGHPNTYPGTDGMLPPGTGVLDRDSNAGCIQDNLRQEDAVFATAPLPGSYLVRVDMVSACGAPSADFVVEVRQDGQLTQSLDGRLLALSADGGGPGTGLFVAQLQF